MRNLPLLLALLLVACTSDTALRVAPDPDPEPSPAAAGPEEGTSGGWGNGGDSPWANLDPGDIPDDLFAVAWLDLTVDCWNCTYAPNSPNRYDLVDALGRVVSSFQVPFEWDEQWWYRPELRSIHASGPGRFIVSNLVQANASGEQVVWEADAFSNTATVLARLRPGEVELPLAGVTLPLPIDSWASDEVVLPDPTDPGRLLIVPHNTSPYLPNELRAIWSVSTTDPDGLVRVWTIDELLPEDLKPEGWDSLDAPWHVGLADDGSGRLVLGLVGVETESDPGDKTVSYRVRPALISIDLDTPDETWVLDTSELGVGGAPLVIPPSPDQPATVVWMPSWCADRVAIWEQGLTAELIVPQTDQCPVLGPMLDPPSRSFLYTATTHEDDYPGSSRLVVSSQGEEVFSLNRLKVGLSERPFAVLGMARVAAE